MQIPRLSKPCNGILFRSPSTKPNNDESATWQTVYSKVDGTLPAEDLPANITFAKAHLNVLVAGQATLKINNPTGLQLWLDDQKLENPTVPFDLKPGRRELTLRIERKIASDLRIEVASPSSSPLKVQPEGGP